MSISKSRITVYFDNPFWAMVYERVEDSALSVCKITFGSEPKDYEVYHFLLENWHLLKFSTYDIGGVKNVKTCSNPKRIQRQISKQLSGNGVGTKSQQAIKQMQEKNKKERKQNKRQLQKDEQARQFELRTQKRKQKHKGH